MLSAYTGTFVAETVRAGVNSVSVGQAEAARALGMSFPQVLAVVILPQALRTVVQPLGSIFIALIKNSALATIIGVPNLSRTVGEVSVDTAPTSRCTWGRRSPTSSSPSPRLWPWAGSSAGWPSGDDRRPNRWLADEGRRARRSRPG